MAAVKTVAEEDQNILEKLIGKTCIEALVKLDLNAQAKKPMLGSERSVTFAPITDRPQRAALHHVGPLDSLGKTRADTSVTGNPSHFRGSH